MYYVGFMSICNGIIGADAIGLPVLFTDCVKVIGSSGVSSYHRGDWGDGIHKFGPIIMLLVLFQNGHL